MLSSLKRKYNEMNEFLINDHREKSTSRAVAMRAKNVMKILKVIKDFFKISLSRSE